MSESESIASFPVQALEEVDGCSSLDENAIVCEKRERTGTEGRGKGPGPHFISFSLSFLLFGVALVMSFLSHEIQEKMSTGFLRVTSLEKRKVPCGWW